MSIFLYGIQSSGVSLTTFFLGQLPRSKQDIIDFDRTHRAWCRSTYGKEWGHTGLRGSAREHVRRLCPSFYE